jgi:hypothetical protein
MRFILFASVVLVVTLFPDAYSQKSKPTLDQLAWIAGCWKNEFPKVTIEEQWMKPAAGSMIGMSRTASKKKTVAYEFLRIVQQGDSLLYISIPSGQVETAFLLTKCTDDEALFENPTHDFPQRIVYHRNNDGSLLAAIEGNENGMLRREEFPMIRVGCDE